MPLPWTKKKLAALLLLAGLGFSIAIMLTMAEFREEIAEPSWMRLDRVVMQGMHAHDTSTLTRFAFTLSWIGSPAALVPALGIAFLVLWRVRLRHDAILLAAAMGGATVLDVALKLHFRRVRPDVPWAFVTEHSFSFPSGHSVGAVVLYGIVTYLLWSHLHAVWQRAAVIAAALMLIVGIGASRVYLGVHYPTDVAAGYLVGLSWLVAVVASDEYVHWAGKRRSGVAGEDDRLVAS